MGPKDGKSLRIKELAVRSSPSNVRSDSHEASPTWLSKYKLNKNDNNTHPKQQCWQETKRPLSYTTNYTQARNAESGSNSLLEKKEPIGYPISNGCS